ncbi:alpha/beta hydrolase [Hymenobacter sp. BT188]|uniref:alpha/beta hydrolase n=1 Tax=Hymenobacter sp. BT188 TaxID=2763504 RepID=UPI0021C5C41C|nr:alpha/beta hydrolase [Hymenobacter sp. BT188]
MASWLISLFSLIYARCASSNLLLNRSGKSNFARGWPSQPASQPETASFIKILLVEAGGNVVVGFQEYHLTHPTLFILNAGQYHHLNEACAGTALCRNRDFYCVKHHDREVAGNSVGGNMATVVALMAKD